MNLNISLDRLRSWDASVKLGLRGFRSLGGWLFSKSGITYDLSAADLDQIERIERDGLFVVEEVK